MKNNYNYDLIYISNSKVTHLIYNFIQKRIDYHFSYRSFENMIYNEQAFINSISYLIEPELYTYLMALIKQYPPYSLIKKPDDIPIIVDLIITKWNPIIKTELESRINYINLSLLNIKRAS